MQEFFQDVSSFHTVKAEVTDMGTRDSKQACKAEQKHDRSNDIACYSNAVANTREATLGFNVVNNERLSAG